MKDLVIRLQPFVFQQVVIIREGSKFTEEKVPQRDLASYISSNYRDIDNVHLFGNEKMAKKIKEECLLKYNLHPEQVNFIFNR